MDELKQTDIFTGKEIQPEFDPKKVDSDLKSFMALAKEIKQVTTTTTTTITLKATNNDKA